MAQTRTHKKIEAELDATQLRAFTRQVLTDLRALERMLNEKMFEKGVRRIGAEQEMFLVDDGYRPTNGALKLMDALDDPHFTTELGLFQLEMNADPVACGGQGLSSLEKQLNELIEKVRRAGKPLGVEPVLTGILPTLKKSDLGLHSMVPSPRYQTLNRVMTRERGGQYEISIKGIDELNITQDSVMAEACNASFQVHLQVDAAEFARMYNVAQVIAAPLLALASNSPLLFGRRLWAETRIALFQQAVDIRSPQRQQLRQLPARVTFGRRWVKDSVLDIFKEDIVRFRALVGAQQDEDSMARLDAGETPDLAALRLFNSTVYRWNRPCYGVIDDKPHLRIENRIMPAGPTVADQIANAAFWIGLMSAMGARQRDVSAQMEFEQAAANFHAAARDGLNANLTWLDGRTISAARLVGRLLPLAEAGLRREKVDAADVTRYLGIIEDRLRFGRTGARWLVWSLDTMTRRGDEMPAPTPDKPWATPLPLVELASSGRNTASTALNALVAATIARQKTGRPVAEWERARLDEAGRPKQDYVTAEQCMTTDLFTVHPDDPAELVSNLMAWERIRHVPVEDSEHRLLGLVSYRAMLRRGGKLTRDNGEPIPASEIMRTNLFTVTPKTSTQDAIAFMRRFRVGCLPVVDDGRLVGMLTEESFMSLASDLLAKRAE